MCNNFGFIGPRYVHVLLHVGFTREECGLLPAFGRLMEANEGSIRGGTGTPTLLGDLGAGGGIVGSGYSPRGHNMYATIGATAPGGPGSTLHGVTHIHLAGNVRISTCVPNINRGLRRRSMIVIHNNHIGSLPNIHCRVVHNALSARNMGNEVRDHSGCNTGGPGTTGGWTTLLKWGGDLCLVLCVYNVTCLLAPQGGQMPVGSLGL